MGCHWSIIFNPVSSSSQPNPVFKFKLTLPLRELYNILHAFAQSLQLEVLYSQVLKLCRERLGDHVTIEEYVLGRSLVLGYWKELSASYPKAELGYRLIISVDAVDSTQPLSFLHQPPMSSEEANQTGEGLKTNQFENIIVHTIQGIG